MPSPVTEVATRPSPSRPTPVPGGARHVPEGASEQAPSSNQRRFVVAFLASCLGVLAAVLALNVVIDPFAIAGSGIVPTAVEPDRSIKLDLLQHLKHGPEILILGSSRSRQAEPAFLQKLTGHTGFNAGVTGGTSANEYVFVRYAADRFPHQRRRYLWFTDVGLAGGGVLPQLANDPRARRYLQGGAGFGLGDVKTYLSTDATKASWRVFRKCVLGSCRSHIHYNQDGSLTNQSLHYLPEHAKSLKKSVAKLIAGVRTHHEMLAQARADLAGPVRRHPAAAHGLPAIALRAPHLSRAEPGRGCKTGTPLRPNTPFRPLSANTEPAMDSDSLKAFGSSNPCPGLRRSRIDKLGVTSISGCGATQLAKNLPKTQFASAITPNLKHKGAICSQFTSTRS